MSCQWKLQLKHLLILPKETFHFQIVITSYSVLWNMGILTHFWPMFHLCLTGQQRFLPPSEFNFRAKYIERHVMLKMLNNGTVFLTFIWIAMYFVSLCLTSVLSLFQHLKITLNQLMVVWFQLTKTIRKINLVHRCFLKSNSFLEGSIFYMSDRSSHRRWSVRKSVLKNFKEFTGKHLHQSLFFNKVAGSLDSRKFRVSVYFCRYTFSLFMLLIFIE